MKVMLIIGSLQGGGAERVMHWLCECLAYEGYEVTLVTQQPKKDDVYVCSEAIYHCSLGGLSWVSKSKVISILVNILRWRRFLRTIADERNPDIIISFLDKVNVSVLLAFFFRREPIIVCERTDPSVGTRSSWRSMVRRLLYRQGVSEIIFRAIRPFLYRQRAGQVIFQTKGTKRVFSKKWRLQNVSTIPNAVTKPFASADVAQATQRVICIGRLHREKGQDLLIKAWSMLGVRRGNWKLILAGEGPEKLNYQAMIDQLNIKDSVEIIGFSRDVIAEIQKASIGVLPSRVEGFPNALIEMMALGRAVIASDLPEACREVIESGKNGLLFDGNSPEELANAISALISDPALCSAIGNSALQVRERYSEETCIKLWIQSIEETVKCD